MTRFAVRRTFDGSWIRALAALIVIGIACCISLLGNPAPAEAHFGGEKPSNYDSYIVSTAPEVPEVSVKTVESGNRVEVSNHTDTPLIVYGYQHQEPGAKDQYLKVTKDGVWVNTKSPAYYLNQTLLGTSVPPDGATEADAKPVWKKVSDQATYRWHDHRAHWMNVDPPPQVQAAPGEHHMIFAGNELFFRYGDTDFTVVVALDWVPENPLPGWITIVAAIAVAGLVGVVRAWRGLAVGALGLLALAEIGHVIVSPYPDDPTQGSFTFALASALVPGIAILGLCALSILYVVRRNPSAYLLIGAAGALAAMQGVSDVGVIWSSQLPQTGPAWLARIIICLVIGLGAGLVIAAVLLARREKPRAADGASRRPVDIASDEEFAAMTDAMKPRRANFSTGAQGPTPRGEDRP